MKAFPHEELSCFFHWRGHRVDYLDKPSALMPYQVTPGLRSFPLAGNQLFRLLADPCSAHLDESMAATRSSASDQERRELARRRLARRELIAEYRRAKETRV